MRHHERGQDRLAGCGPDSSLGSGDGIGDRSPDATLNEGRA